MSTSETITKTDLKNILEAAGNIGQVDSTPTPTASKVSEFDAAAQMNSTDMTSSEVTSFVEDLNIEGGGSGTSIPTANTVAKFDANANMNSSDMTNSDVEDFVDSLVTGGGSGTTETYIQNYTQTYIQSYIQSQIEDIVATYVNNKGFGFVNYTETATVASGGSFNFSTQVTTHGRPVLIVASCCWNPDGAGYWASMYVSRDGTVLKQTTMACGSSASYNVPGAVSYIDNVPAGTYTYTCTCLSGSGSGTFAENNGSRSESPVLCVIEI